MTDSAMTPLDSAAFRDAFRSHPAGVGVVTTESAEGPVAMTATSITSVSVDPPILAYSVSDQSSTSSALNAAETVVVHLLDSLDQPLAELCATSGSDRFGGAFEWRRLATGEPFFTGAFSVMRCRVRQRVRTGTGTVTILEALTPAPGDLTTQTSARDANTLGAPLAYVNRTWNALGPGSQI